MAIHTEKELAAALKGNQDTIEIEGDLAKKVIRIKATGRIVWGVVISCLAVSVVAILATPATGGASNVAHFVASPVVISGLGGVGTASTAIGIAVAAGGVFALKRLRKYKIDKKSPTHIVLRRS